MADTTPGSGPSPVSMPLLARLVGVLTSPRDTFAAVVSNPKWLGALMVVTIISTVFATLPMTTEAGQQAALDASVSRMESFGMQVSDEMYAQMERGKGKIAMQTAIGVLLMSPVISFIMAGILFAIFNAAMGGDASYKQVLAVLVHASVISALGQIFTGTVNYFRGAVTSATNLGVLLPVLDETSFLGRLVGMIDLFIIWWLVVLAIGLAVLSKRRTQPIAITLFVLYAVIAIGMAAFMSTRS